MFVSGRKDEFLIFVFEEIKTSFREVQPSKAPLFEFINHLEIFFDKYLFN